MNPATRFFADLNAGDVEKALAKTTEDFTWTVAGKPEGRFALAGVYRKQQYLDMLGRVTASLPQGPQMQVTSVTQTTERVVVEARVRGRSVDGPDYDNQLAYVFDIEGDKISAVREYLDTIHAAEVFTK